MSVLLSSAPCITSPSL